MLGDIKRTWCDRGSYSYDLGKPDHRYSYRRGHSYSAPRQLKRQWFLRNVAFLALITYATIFFGHDARSQAISSNDASAKAVSPPLAEEFIRIVGQHLVVPAATALDYAVLLDAALAVAGIREITPKFILLVDRNPNVQVLLLYWGTAEGSWTLVGASSISTGLPGRYQHFKTPLGVFEHSLENPDFRAEGTKNQFGIRGYGNKGSRIYDFGWVKAPRGWGDGHIGELRLQMHSTDPDVLEQRIGTAQSEGCIRIPSQLNDFIDHYGILDEDYDRVVAAGNHLWVLQKDRVPTPWSGRYLVVLESAVATRPEWAMQVPKRR